MKKLLLLIISIASVFTPICQASTEWLNEQQNMTYFLENKGQVKQTDGNPAPYVNFLLEKGGATIYLLETGIAWQFNKVHYPEGYEALMTSTAPSEDYEELSKQVRIETYRMDMTFLGANPHPEISTEGRSNDYINYYNHDVLDVHHYKKIIYHDVYPGIDWVIYSTEQGIKYDFNVAPGANPNLIKMKFSNHEELYINQEGNLIHGNRMGQFIEEKPVSIQNNREVRTSFLLEGDILQFLIAEYDHAQPLVIDPSRAWATYYGGSGFDYFTGLTSDSNGDIIMSGSTTSSSAIASGGHQNSFGGNTSIGDGVVVKFNNNGVRQWATYYGGSGEDRIGTVKTDGGNNIFAFGWTSTTTGMTSGGHQNSYGGGPHDGLIVKFNSAGVRQWATYYGNSGNDSFSWGTLDASGNIFATGNTTSTSGVATSGSHQTTYGGGAYDALITKFDASGSLQWATYFGGSGNENISFWRPLCGTDSNGNIYHIGETNSTNGIASGGHQNTYGGSTSDAYLAKFNGSGVLQWATYYGGSGTDRGGHVMVDGSDNVYLMGGTGSSSGIASGGHQNTYGGGTWDGFLVKFNSSGVRQWATYYGGSGTDEMFAGFVDGNNNIYVPGGTFSSSGIASGGYQNTYAGSNGAGLWGDAFVVKFNSSGVRDWATYYGGSGDDAAGACLVDGNNNVYINGVTVSTTGIASSGSHQTTYGNGIDGFLAKLGPLVWTGTSNTTWSVGGNWNLGTAPTTCGDDVLIPLTTNQPVINSTATVGDITIHSGVTITNNSTLNVCGDITANSNTIAGTGTVNLIGTGNQILTGALKVEGIVNVNTGSTLVTTGATLTLENGASLMHGTGTPGAGGSVTGNITVKRQGTSSGIKYNYWSSPVANGTLPGGNQYEYLSVNGTNTNTDDNPGPDPGWSPFSGTMQNGRGYAATMGGLASFTGTPNNGGINVPVTFYGLAPASTSPNSDFVLLGNPYPSGLTINTFLGDNSNLQGQVWAWDDDNSGGIDYFTSDYASRTGAGSISGGNGNSLSAQLATCQGFMAKVINSGNGGVAKFENDQRSSGAATFLKTEEESSRIWLSLTNDTMYNEINIVFMEGATTAFDNMLDGHKLRGNAHIAFAVKPEGSTAQEDELCIAALPPVTEETIVALTAFVANEGIYTISNKASEYMNNMDVYLEDRLANSFTLLNNNGQYSTLMNVQNTQDRFFLHFAPALTGINQPTKQSLTAWVASNELVVLFANMDETSGTIRISDITGKEVFVQNSVNTKNTVFRTDVSQLAAGMYVVSFITNNSVYSNKLIIR